MQKLIFVVLMTISLTVPTLAQAKCMKDGKRIKGVKSQQDCDAQQGTWKEKKKKKMMDSAKKKMDKAKQDAKKTKDDSFDEATETLDNMME